MIIFIPGTTRIGYDDDKDELNIEKHGYSLSCAEDVINDIMFFQPNYIISDEYMENEEVRFLILGEYEGRVVLIACNARDEGKLIRPISMRSASKKEREIFNENPPHLDITALFAD